MSCFFLGPPRIAIDGVLAARLPAYLEWSIRARKAASLFGGNSSLLRQLKVYVIAQMVKFFSLVAQYWTEMRGSGWRVDLRCRFCSAILEGENWRKTATTATAANLASLIVSPVPRARRAPDRW